MGRRKLLLSTLVLCAIADYLFILFSLISQGSVSSEAQWSSFAFAISFFLYGVGYNLGTGPVAYFIPGELVPPEATSASLGMAVAVNWICTMITTLLFYPLNQAIGGWAYSLFAVPTTFFVIFLYLTLPETKTTLCLEIVMDDEQLLGANDGLKYGTFNDLTGRQKVY
uniref:Major facilitator superfamily (MFS) profile domain-containing protein n=1 Tax=Plectus sambesii TaxID=2011161 RepID=A0A914X432_9BILA